MPFSRACVALLGLLPACSCSKDGASEGAGEHLDLLARRPDEVFELPGALVPQGDVPGTSTWGASEGPGWAQTDLRLADGTAYRETNQARASLMLPATRPAERELVLGLWCARAVEDPPARVTLRLNGVPLVAEGLALTREPGLQRVHAPAAAWRLGANWLELAVPVREVEGRHAWDTLALARVEYGAPARVRFEPEGSVRLGDGTGVRYALELADAARVTLVGAATGPGRLVARAGVLDRRTGQVEIEAEPLLSLADAKGTLRAELPLTRRTEGARVLELEWNAPAGGELVLERLSAVERASRARPPIVFVSIDTFAARHLSTYGYARETTPELARFQGEAVTFERCLANAPWTLPSYLSVMSGLYPRAHWVDLDFQQDARIQSFDQFTLAPNRWTIAEALRARGYRTAGFVDTQWLSPQSGLEQGFDVYNGDAALAPFSDVHAGIELIVERLLPGWLATTGGERPPFVFLHALDAHGPYLPEEPFRDAFFAHLPAQRTQVVTGSLNQTYRTIPRWMGLTLVPGEETPLPETQAVEELIARYDETLLKVDAYLGKLFALLRERGLYDDAVIVVTGDHGEYFGPGMYGHGIMRESVLHVPLFLKLPRGAHGGLRVNEPVALVDVYPTLLELAGVAPDPALVHGTSLTACLERRAAPAERALFSEGGHVEQYALTLGRWRLVEERPGSESSEASLLTHPRVPDEWLRAHAPELQTRPLTEELLADLLKRPGFREALRTLRTLVAGPYYSLFDAESDPGDLRDLAAEKPEVVARLKPLLEAERARSLRARAEAAAVVVRPLSPAQLDELEKLGYGGGSASEEKGAEEAGE